MLESRVADAPPAGSARSARSGRDGRARGAAWKEGVPDPSFLLDPPRQRVGRRLVQSSHQSKPGPRKGNVRNEKDRKVDWRHEHTQNEKKVTYDRSNVSINEGWSRPSTCQSSTYQSGESSCSAFEMHMANADENCSFWRHTAVDMCTGVALVCVTLFLIVLL